MTKKQAIQLLEERKVRTIWDDEQEKWYFSIVDESIFPLPLFFLNRLRGKPFNRFQGLRCKGTCSYVYSYAYPACDVFLKLIIMFSATSAFYSKDYSYLCGQKIQINGKNKDKTESSAIRLVSGTS